MYTREQIRENRLKFAKGLQEPHREREKNQLENPNYPNKRCCLGHGCDIFNIERKVDNSIVRYGTDEKVATAPQELVILLGLFDCCGGSMHHDDKLFENYGSLTAINDDSNMPPQEIGKLIEEWIEGGKGTPFRTLESYPETLEK